MSRPTPPHRTSTTSPPLVQSQSREGGSASSSVTAAGPSRSDQVIHRYYLKTVAVLVDGRLTHYSKSEKKDKWFNLSLPEVDLHRADLQIYKTISSYEGYAVPPLLVAFILDTSDLHSGQALMWNRGGAKYTLDPKGKGRGIVLERWTLNASPPDPTASMAAPTAYRLGIIHFRALYAVVRLLPAYRLFRRLRRGNIGLRLGIKLWAPEGYSEKAAWEVMERGLVGLGTGLDHLAVPGAPREARESYEIPPTDLFGTKLGLKVEYRPEVDFTVEDMESILSEKFVDMDEEWFKPTVQSARKPSAPTPIPSTSPIPQRQQGPKSAGSRWGSLAEGLPFVPSGSSPSSIPSGAAIAARRLSGHSIHPFNASPSTSQLRQTPPIRPGSSVGRTSSFLSQSGRSFTHAQLANMSPSPPVSSPISPSSLSFTKQPIPRPVDGTSPGTSPQMVKRLASQNSTLLRRTSTRTSQESGLRHSVAGPDDDDIQSFLKTLDALPQPPIVAAQAVHASRSHLPSTSSSLSNPSIPPSPSPMHASIEPRAPMTRQQVDDALKRMAGSFNVSPPPPSVGLLSASRPVTARRPSTPAQSEPDRMEVLPGPRSLPTSEPPLKSPAIAALLSPQTTGSSSTGSSRRGPVLLRGGFEPHHRASTSSSPSHSPIRDFARLGLGTGNGQRRKPPGQRTAPSSFGAGPEMDEDRGRRRGPMSEKGYEDE